MSADINWADRHIKSVREKNDAVNGLANLLEEFGLDDAGNDEIPKDVKSEYIKGHLLTAIQVISQSINNDIHELEKLLESRKSS